MLVANVGAMELERDEQHCARAAGAMQISTAVDKELSACQTLTAQNDNVLLLSPARGSEALNIWGYRPNPRQHDEMSGAIMIGTRGHRRLVVRWKAQASVLAMKILPEPEP